MSFLNTVFSNNSIKCASAIAMVIYAVNLNLAHAYQPSSTIQIAAPADTPIKLLMGYDTRRGVYKEQCIRRVKGTFKQKTNKGANPKSSSNFRQASSYDQLIQDRNLSVSARASANMGVWSASAKVDTNFEDRYKSETHSNLVQIKFQDLESPVFSNFNAEYRLNERGQEAFKALKKGNMEKFIKKCGDSVVLGTVKGRTLDAIGKATIKKTQSSSAASIDTELAGRYMMMKAGVQVGLSKAEEKAAKDIQIEISYALSGDARVAAPTSIGKLKKLYSDFTLAKNQTSSLLYVYHMPIFDVVDGAFKQLSMSAQHRKKVTKIFSGLAVLESAKNAALRDLLATKAINEERTYTANRKTQETDGIYVPQLKETEPYERALSAFKREYAIVRAQLISLGGCTVNFGKACESLYGRLQQYGQSTDKNSVNQGKTAWFKKFLHNAYASENACKVGFPVSNPNGSRQCKRCKPAKEPRFDNANQGRCDYIISKKRKSKKNVRLLTHDLMINESQRGKPATYHALCNGKKKGCGMPAADRICQAKQLGKAVAFEAWRWRPSNKINPRKYSAIYANGKACKEVGKEGSTPIKCEIFKMIECNPKMQPRRTNGM